MAQARSAQIALCMLLGATCAMVPASELRDNTSLRWTPDSVAMYVAMFRMEQQWDIFEQSNAFKKLKSIPMLQMGIMQAKQQWNAPEGKMSELREFIENPANAGLIQLAKEMFATEVFICGDQRIGDLIYELNRANQAGSMSQLKKLAGDRQGSGEEDQLELIIDALAKAKVPNLVMGFRVADAKNALDQLTRLETELREQLEDETELGKRLRRTTSETGQFLQFNVDEGLVPWNKAIEDGDLDQEQVDRIRGALKGKKLYVNLGVVEGYVYLGVTSGSDPIEMFHTEGLLIDSEPFAKVREVEDKQITSLGFVTGDFLNAVSRPKEDLRQVAELGKAVLEQSDLDEDLVSSIQADIDELLADLVEYIPEQGTVVGAEYLIESGYEGFQQSWAENKFLDATKPLRLLSHVGNPLMLYAARNVIPDDATHKSQKWLKKGLDYAERFARESDDLDEAQLALFEDFAKRLGPFADRWMEISATDMKAAMSDGESAIVVDAKLEPKSQWHAMMPAGSQPLPMLEFASLARVTDAERLEKGLNGYVEVGKAAMEEIKQLFEDHASELAEQLEGDAERLPQMVQQLKMPETVRTEASGGQIYQLTALQKMGFGEQLAPSLGWSDDVMVVALSPDTVERYFNRADGSDDLFLGKGDESLASALHVDFSGMISQFKPWIDYGMNLAAQENGMVLMFAPQVDTFLEVISCFKTHTSVTYAEGDSLVTFYRQQLQDLE